MKDRLEKLLGHSAHLLDAFLGLSQKTILFLPMVRDKKLISICARGHRAEGFRVLRFALFSSCAQDVIKLTLDKDNKAPSIINIMKILSDNQIQQELRKRYSEYRLPRETPSIIDEKELVKFEKQESARLASEFDKYLLELEQAWRDFNSQPWITGFHKLRDKHTAHLELSKTKNGYEPIAFDSLNLKWNDLDDAVNRLEKIVLKVNAIARQAGFAIDAAREQFNRTSIEFWKSVTC